jgi:phosphatidylserine/phosphatidylglycerophosphate/cardiolipin synthase-like enzyme
MPKARSLLAAASLVALAASAACAPAADEPLGASESNNTETDCAAMRDTRVGKPTVFFAPFDEPEKQALCVLSTAKREVVIAHYNIRREGMIAKLVELKNRGVDVRVAVDEHNAAADWNVGDDALEAAGIELVRTKPGGSGAIMHLKVTVIDGEIAMTGSFNWNETAALANDENMLVFKDPEIVQRYRTQVLEVLGEKARERQPPQATPNVRVHFSPEEKTDAVIAAEIDRATTSLDVAMFTFTQATIAAAVQRAAQRGVAVRVVVERKQTGMTTVDEGLERSGATLVRGANTIGQFSAMHQKYAIVDRRVVLTGATNWTNAGTRTNEEDLLVIDSPDVAVKYRKNFADLMSVYGGSDVTSEAPDALANERAPVLFNPIHDATAYGDRVVVVGSDPALGAWDPRQGVDAHTHSDLFPSWTAAARLPAGAVVEYKYVTLHGDGRVSWEPGPNRVVTVPATGRAVVQSGAYGDTAKSWTPRTR